jgi:hypothetical protein
MPLFMMLIVICLGNWCRHQNKMGVLEMAQMRLHVVDLEAVRAVKNTTLELISEAEKAYPANASGISRILPWNWDVEPVMPADSLEAFEILKSYSIRSFNPYDLSGHEPKLRAINTLGPPDKVQAVKESITSLTANLPILSSKNYILLTPEWTGSLGLFFFVPAILVFSRFINRRMKSKTTKRRGLFGLFLRYGGIPFASLFAVEYLALMSLVSNTRLPFAISGATIGLCFVIGLVIQKLNWPKNSLLRVAAEVVPAQDLDHGKP